MVDLKLAKVGSGDLALFLDQKRTGQGSGPIPGSRRKSKMTGRSKLGVTGEKVMEAKRSIKMTSPKKKVLCNM